MNYLLERFREPSTYKGLLAILAAFGLTFDPEQTQAVVAAVIALLGVWEVFRREAK